MYLLPPSSKRTFRPFRTIFGVLVLVSIADLAAAASPSWIFRRSQFSHDPVTGARVAQYSRIPPVEPLGDPRAFTSVYRRSRSVLRGADGAVDSYYQVQSYGNGRGGLDAEWERFHDAWKESYITGGYYRQGYPHYGYSQPRHAYPHGGYPHGGHPQWQGRPTPYGR